MFRRFSLGLVLIIVLFGSILHNLIPDAQAEGSEWVKYPANPILTSTPGSWDADYTIQPRVLYLGNLFRMYYVGSRQGILGIGYGTSSDGIKWTKHGAPILTPGPLGSWDSSLVGLGSVLWNGTLYLMWYRGKSPGLYDDGAFGLATSSDGMTWKKYPRNPVLTPSSVDEKLLTDPYVIRQPALYGMWYAARNSSDPRFSQILRILYAISFDGVNWAKFNLVALSPSIDAAAWDSGNLFSPSVFYAGAANGYGMWYSALNQSFQVPAVGYATSRDGVYWTKSPENPILTHGSLGSWDSGGVENQDVILAKGAYMMYYDGFRADTGSSIGLAFAPAEFAIPELSYQSIDLLLGMLILATAFLIFHRRREWHRYSITR